MAVSATNWIGSQSIPCPLIVYFVFSVSSSSTTYSLRDVVTFAWNHGHHPLDVHVPDLVVVDLIGCDASTVRADWRYRATFGFPIGIVDGVDVVSEAPAPQNANSITVLLSIWSHYVV